MVLCLEIAVLGRRGARPLSRLGRSVAAGGAAPEADISLLLVNLSYTRDRQMPVNIAAKQGWPQPRTCPAARGAPKSASYCHSCRWD
jgi:hypothetical protein